MTYTASCHCGNVQLKIEKMASSISSCNCSICSRYAALWGYHSSEQVLIELGEFGLKSYRWGDEMIDFFACSHCASITHSITLEKSKMDRLAINYRMFDLKLYQDLTVNKIDGASW